MTEDYSNVESNEIKSPLLVLDSLCKKKLAILKEKLNKQEDGLKACQKVVAKQFTEIDTTERYSKIFPLYSKFVLTCYHKVALKYADTINKKIFSLNKTKQSIVKSIDQIEEISNSIKEKLRLVNSKIDDTKKETESDIKSLFVEELKDKIKETRSSLLFKVENNIKNKDKKLKEKMLQEKKVSDMCIKTEERIKNICSACKNISNGMTIAIKNKSCCASKRNGFTICSYPAEDINIKPFNHSRDVDLGNLIVLAPIRSLTRRQKYIDL